MQELPKKPKVKLPRGKNIPLDVGYRTLMKQIAQSSGYHMHEVEDVMLHFVVAMQRNLEQLKTVQIHEFGKFSVFTSEMPEVPCGLNGKPIPARTDYKIRYSPAVEMKRRVSQKYKIQENQEE